MLSGSFPLTMPETHMFGFYDPASLRVDGARAEIDFIEATGGALTRVAITTAEQARGVARSLRGQMRNGISSIANDLTEITGSLALTPERPDEGLLIPDGARKPIPVKLAFEVDRDALPRTSYAKAIGAPVDGAFVIAKIAMKALAPGAERQPHGQQPA